MLVGRLQGAALVLAQAEVDFTALFQWLSQLGKHWGILAFGMFLTAWTIRGCLPQMWRDHLDYKKATQENSVKLRRLELKVTEKIHEVQELAARNKETLKLPEKRL